MDRLNPLSRTRMKKLLLAAFLLGPSSAAIAADDTSIFAEAAGGYTHVKPQKGDGTSKNGYHLLASAFVEVTSDAWVYQAGGGFFYNRIYSDGEKEFAGSQANTVREQKKLRIETRAGEAEAAARYRLGHGLEAGLLARVFFGSSLSFSQEKDSKSAKVFAGPQLVMRIGSDSEWIQRLDINLTTDLNVPKRTVYLLTAGFALGKSLGYSRSSSERTPPEPPVPEDRYEAILADKVINFDTSSSQVRGPALAFLKDLGQFLKANPDIWNEVNVEGHTDKKGRLEYNMKLSKDRARSVLQVLLDQGADAKKLHSEGYGPTKPLIDQDTPEALAANRRVVMIFNVSGREQRNKLSSYIQDLRKKYFNE